MHGRTNEDINEATDTTVHTVKAPVRGKSANRQPAQSQHKRPEPQKLQRECWNCGQVHDVTNSETCPAYGRECRKCHKQNHFASRCRSKWPAVQRVVRAVDTEECEEDDETFQWKSPQCNWMTHI